MEHHFRKLIVLKTKNVKQIKNINYLMFLNEKNKQKDLDDF